MGKCNLKRGVRLEALEAAVIDALTERAGAIAQFADTTPVEEPPEIKDLGEQLAGLEQVATATKNVNPVISEAIRKLRNQIEF